MSVFVSLVNVFVRFFVCKWEDVVFLVFCGFFFFGGADVIIIIII